VFPAESFEQNPLNYLDLSIDTLISDIIVLEHEPRRNYATRSYTPPLERHL
jgi:hypothetical protein